LNAGDSTAGLAFELADRESRLGRPADGARLYAALRAWAVRSGNSADRADRIIARFNSYASPPPSPDGSALEHAVPIRPNPSG
jgi:hypothetical protein